MIRNKWKPSLFLGNAFSGKNLLILKTHWRSSVNDSEETSEAGLFRLRDGISANYATVTRDHRVLNPPGRLDFFNGV